MRYLTQRRMQVAAALLFASEVGLAEVAARVGYVSEFAFNRAFKRHYRMPPGEYRRHVSTPTTVAMRLAA
jgi:AraC-like DNA-binding protein